MPRGVLNYNKQLDALAATIVGSTEVKRVAKKLKITTHGVYKLAKSAIKRLTPTDDARALKTLRIGKPIPPKAIPV